MTTLTLDRAVPKGTPVVAIVGDPGAGKDTAGRLLDQVLQLEDWSGVRSVAFADTLKVGAYFLLGREATRRELQTIGTATLAVDQYAFVRSVHTSLLEWPPKFVIVTDPRYPHEFEWLDRHNAEYVRLARTPEPGHTTLAERDHISSWGWRTCLAERSYHTCPNYTPEDTITWWKQFVEIMGWQGGRNRNSDDGDPNEGLIERGSD